MKDILFNVLDNLEPYKIIKLGINNSEFYICRADSCLPIAVRFLDYEPEMETSNYFYSYEQDYSSNYVNSHKVNFRSNDYLIETEISDIQYYNDYLHVTYNCVGGQSEYFISYDSISFIGCSDLNTVSASSKIVVEYNKIQYELNKGE